MKIFGVGPLELTVIAILILLVLGPEGMVDAGRTAGKYLRQLYLSDFWQVVRGKDNWLKRIAGEMGITADLEDVRREVNQNRLPTLDDLDDIKARRSNLQKTSSPSPQPRAQGPDEKEGQKASTSMSSETVGENHAGDPS